jgi:hypothetical protein
VTTAHQPAQHQPALRTPNGRVLRIPEVTVRDPRGGITTAAVVIDRMARAHARIDADERAGSHRHDRISRGQRRSLRLLPVLDGVVLLWFLVGVLNVDLRRPDPTLVVAVALALLGTLAVAAWSAAVGEHLRRSKDADRRLVWAAVDGTGRGMVVLTAAMVGLLAVLMFVRVSDEVHQATGDGGTIAVVVALALAGAVVLLNLYILYLSMSDGSAVTTELDRLGRALRPHLRRHERAETRAAAVRRTRG